MSSSPRILISPLEWGLGHAARIVPVIRELQIAGAEVVIGSSGAQATFLRSEFPDLEVIPFPAYNITYPRSGQMAMRMLLSSPGILRTIRKERIHLNRVIAEQNIDGVISDNRFGLYSDAVPSIYITHQIHIQAPFFEGGLYRMHKRYINRFSECWIPDVAGEPNLSGALSHHAKMPGNCHFIGPLSRFAAPETPMDADIDVLCMISGPEPQRTLFEEIGLNQLKDIDGKKVLLRGLPDGADLPPNAGDVTIHHHLETESLAELIARSKLVVSRPGYSTLMDLAVSGTPALFVPTPGQTEQVYLAKHHSANGNFMMQQQNELNIRQALENNTSKGIRLASDFSALRERMKALMERVS